MQMHRTKIPIDHPDRSVTRAKLEYPTEYVSFRHLAVIDKIVSGLENVVYGRPMQILLVRDAFTDKSVYGYSTYGVFNVVRRVDEYNYYAGNVDWYSTAPIVLNVSIYCVEGGSLTEIAFVRLGAGNLAFGTSLSVSGSTLKNMFWSMGLVDPLNLPTPEGMVTATDTTFASGRFGTCVRHIENPASLTEVAYLLPPSSPSNPALAVLEVGVEGSGVAGDPFRPGLLSERLKTAPTKVGEGDVEASVESDAYAVSWGCFEFSRESATNIVAVFGDSPLKPGALQRQIEHARSRGLRVLRAPRDYREAVEQYRMLRRDFPGWLAGVHNWCYQAMGLEVFDWMQNADFYYGELIEHRRHYDQLKSVPDWEISRRLSVLEEKLRSITILAEERERHLGKLREIMKRGW
jgi:hypothetical protein